MMGNASPAMDQSLHRSGCAGCHGTGRVRAPTVFRTPGESGAVYDMTKIKISLQDAEVGAAFNRLLRASPDLSPVVLAVPEHRKDRVIESFGQEASPHGNPWKPLQPATQMDRQRRGLGPAGSMPVRNADLLRSIVTDHGLPYLQNASLPRVATRASHPL